MLREWSGAAVDPGAERPAPETWEPVEVPGRPDAFAGADAVAYRTTFPDPRSPDESRALLELRGLYAHARVWLNDDLVAEHDAYFQPLRVDFEPEAENDLVVTCRRPTDRFGGIHDSPHVPPSAAVPGIWWDASVSGRPASYVADVRATPRLTDDGAAIDVAIDVVAGRDLDDRLTLSLRPAGDLQRRGTMDRVGVAAAAGERTTVEYTIEVRDPALWWPRGIGSQHRYTVRAKLDDDARTTTTGIRSVALTEDGLEINGEPVPVRGLTLLSATADDVERAVACNANLVRLHAHAPAQAVYEAADDAGVLVWQDLPLTGPDAFDVDRGRELARTLGRSYGHHPSLAAFAVHDEPLDPFDDRLGSGTLDRWRFRWRAWRSDYDREPAVAVAEELPATIPSFPVVGPPGTGPDAATLYPGWDYGEPEDVAWLLDTYPSLADAVGAFGVGSVGVEDPREFAGFDRENHDVHADVADREGSQAYQARALKTVAETLRRRDGDIAVAATVRDLADAGMGVFDRDGEPKCAAETLTAAFEPVQAMLADPTGGPGEVVVVNDTPEAVSGTLAWTAGGETGEMTVSVDAYGQASAGSVPAPSNGHVELMLTTDDRTVSNEYRL
ncbi:MAG: hydrolase [Haloarculaceae archaeon]